MPSNGRDPLVLDRAATRLAIPGVIQHERSAGPAGVALAVPRFTVDQWAAARTRTFGAATTTAAKRGSTALVCGPASVAAHLKGSASLLLRSLGRVAAGIGFADGPDSLPGD